MKMEYKGFKFEQKELRGMVYRWLVVMQNGVKINMYAPSVSGLKSLIDQWLRDD